jgi:hypothetical protein
LISQRVLFATPGKRAPLSSNFSAGILRLNCYQQAIRYVPIYFSAEHTKDVSANHGNLGLYTTVPRYKSVVDG